MVKRYFHWHPTDDCVTDETDGAGSALVTYNHEPGQFGSLISEKRDTTTYTDHFRDLIHVPPWDGIFPNATAATANGLIVDKDPKGIWQFVRLPFVITADVCADNIEDCVAQGFEGKKVNKLETCI
jgi:hypothetical protein